MSTYGECQSCGKHAQLSKQKECTSCDPIYKQKWKPNICPSSYWTKKEAEKHFRENGFC